MAILVACLPLGRNEMFPEKQKITFESVQAKGISNFCGYNSISNIRESSYL